MAGQCLKRVPLQQPLRLLGVRVGKLAREDEAALAVPAPVPAHVAEPIADLFGQTGN